MRLALITLVLLPTATFAADKSLYPTNRELYEECKTAVKIAEGGNNKAFLKTYCAARIDGIMESFYIMTAGILDLPTAEGKAAGDVVKAQAARLCQLSQPYDEKGEFPEVILARQFVADIDNWEKENPEALKNFLSKPTAVAITSSMMNHCKNAKSHS